MAAKLGIDYKYYRDIARSHSALALTTLAEICGDSAAPAPARIGAAVALLDRGWGKPEQKIDVDVSKMSDAEIMSIVATIPGVRIEAPDELSLLTAKSE